jgi:cellobionic acid phosphorylase
MHIPSESGFNQAGDCYRLTAPRSLERADYDLWNDQFRVTADHAGKVEGHVFTPNAQPYAEALRPVYCRDAETGEWWSLSWGPVFRDPETFSFDVHIDHVAWRIGCAGIRSELRLALPRGAALEAWELVLHNDGDAPRRLSVTPAFPLGLLGLLSQESEYLGEPAGILHNYFPYYVKIPDYAKMARRWNTTFLFASEAPASWTALERGFLGFDGWHAPEALAAAALAGEHCHYERGLCAMRHELVLQPGASRALGWIFGPAKSADHAREIRAAWDPGTAFARALAEQRAFRASCDIPLRIHSPDTDFDHYINLWSPDRSIRIGRTYRFNPSPQARNAIQDTMTLALFDPPTARARFKEIWRHQQADGFMPHGLPMVDDAELMPITLIPHKDTNVWGPIALDAYLRETHDLEFFDEPVPYVDGGSGSIADHIERGLRWLLRERSPRGLSLIGQGDWNDPLNMAGPEGRGESVWLSEALALVLDLWADTCRRRGTSGDEWRAAAGECRAAVREHCWDGDWFLRAVSDDGTPIGSHANPHGAIYLNAQSWALMAGIPDARQTDKMIAAVNRHLGTRIAPALLGPAYPGMAAHVGKLTLKSPGTGENGSIYSHAALFWSHALYACGRPDDGWRVLRNLLPGTPDNPVASAGQLPLYIPNFYRGPAAPDVFGRSSHSPNTGSAAWVYMTVIEQVLGLRGDGDHLVVRPQLPPEWDRVEGVRVFRGARYRFTFERRAGVDSPQVSLDGQPAGDRIAWPGDTAEHTLEVQLPPCG